MRLGIAGSDNVRLIRIKKRLWKPARSYISLLFLSLLFSTSADSLELQNYPALLILTEELQADGFEPTVLQRLFGAIEFQQIIIDAMTNPAEKSMTWNKYRGLFIKPERIQQGVDFWHAHQADLSKAALEYGVAQEVIVAIIGVESRFGEYRGKHGVFESLATLVAGYPRRSAFFGDELKAFLLLCREQGFNPLAVKGSYAGAVGYPQFIATSYRAYAVDFNGDGRTDIINDPVDAIGSVANYFKKHGWRVDEPVTSEFSSYSQALLEAPTVKLATDRTVAEIEKTGAKLVDLLEPGLKVGVVSHEGNNGPVVRLAHHNFYVITKYNRSTMYAMAVHELSQAIKVAMGETQ